MGKKFLSSRNKFFNSPNIYDFVTQIVSLLQNKKSLRFFKTKTTFRVVLDDLLKNYFVKLGTIIIKKKLISSLKFNPNYNIIGDYDFIIRSKNLKAWVFKIN